VRELKLVGWVERVWKTVDEADDLGVGCRARRLLIYVSMSVCLSARQCVWSWCLHCGGLAKMQPALRLPIVAVDGCSSPARCTTRCPLAELLLPAAD